MFIRMLQNVGIFTVSVSGIPVTSVAIILHAGSIVSAACRLIIAFTFSFDAGWVCLFLSSRKTSITSCLPVARHLPHCCYAHSRELDAFACFFLKWLDITP